MASLVMNAVTINTRAGAAAAAAGRGRLGPTKTLNLNPITKSNRRDVRPQRRAGGRLVAAAAVDGKGDVAAEEGDADTTALAAAAAVVAEVVDSDGDFDADEYKAVVKLLVTFLEPDWVNPWQTKTAQRSTGGGCYSC
jgi:hypothetical protein